MVNGTAQATNTTISADPGFLEKVDTLYQCVSNPLSCAANAAFSAGKFVAEKIGGPFFANRMYDITSAPTYLISLAAKIVAKAPDAIIHEATDMVGYPVETEFYSKIAGVTGPLTDFINSLVTIGAPPKTPLNTLHLILPFCAYYWFSKKARENITDLNRSVSLLTRGIFSNKWTSDVYIPSLPGSVVDVGYNAGYTASDGRSAAELHGDFWSQVGFTAAWTTLATMTQWGIRNAVAEATDSKTADNIIKAVAIAIFVLQFFRANPQNVIKQSDEYVTSYKPNTIKINRREFSYIDEEDYSIDELLKDINKIDGGTAKNHHNKLMDDKESDDFGYSDCDLPLSNDRALRTIDSGSSSLELSEPFKFGNNRVFKTIESSSYDNEVLNPSDPFEFSNEEMGNHSKQPLKKSKINLGLSNTVNLHYPGDTADLDSPNDKVNLDYPDDTIDFDSPNDKVNLDYPDDTVDYDYSDDKVDFDNPEVDNPDLDLFNDL